MAVLHVNTHARTHIHTHIYVSLILSTFIVLICFFWGGGWSGFVAFGILVPSPGIKLMPSATTREVPRVNILKANLQNGSITALDKFLSDETCIFTYIGDN